MSINKLDYKYINNDLLNLIVGNPIDIKNIQIYYCFVAVLVVEYFVHLLFFSFPLFMGFFYDSSVLYFILFGGWFIVNALSLVVSLIC